VGVLKVVADARELLAVAPASSRAHPARRFLIREDGSIVFSRRGVGGQAQFFAADLFRERMKSYKAGDRSSGSSSLRATRTAGRTSSASHRASSGELPAHVLG